MFAPRSIVLVGASEKSIWSFLIIKSFADLGFDGALYAVNRGGVAVHGVAGYTSCDAIGSPIDLAFVFVPQGAVLDALDDAGAAGIRNVAILASGYAEVAGEGALARAALLKRAAGLGIHIWGPNTLGFNNMSARTPVSAIPVVKPILPPSIAIVSQSGATASELNEFAHSQNVGTSFVAATGNEGDVKLADVVDYLVDHAPTKAIAIFAETIRDPQAFAVAAMRARTLAKPIVILKIGCSPLAGAVAAAHTGSLVGNDAVFDAVCERLGIVQVHSAEDLVNVSALLAATGPLSAPGFSFISISGGACTLVADGAEEAGIALPANGPETVAALAAILPNFASSLNPLDITGAAVRDPSLFERILPIIAGAEGIGLVGINMTVPTVEGQGLPAALEATGRALPNMAVPAMVSTAVKALNEVSRAAIAAYGLPHVVTGIDPMLRAVGKATWWSQQLGRPARPLPLLDQPPAVAPALATERAVLDYLAVAGVPVVPGRIARSVDEAVRFAREIAAPLAMKIASPDIAHKTEAGGVRLDVAPEDAAATYEAIRKAVAAARPDAAIDGVILSPMRSSGGGVELLVGVTRDPSWGLTITIGFGGVLVEVLADVVLAPLPVERGDGDRDARPVARRAIASGLSRHDLGRSCRRRRYHRADRRGGGETRLRARLAGGQSAAGAGRSCRGAGRTG